MSSSDSHFDGRSVNSIVNIIAVIFKALEDEESMTREQLAIKNVGKQVTDK